VTVSDLNTPETMILEALVGRVVSGAGSWTFEHRLFLKPYLESLTGKGLVTYRLDEDANWVVTPTPALATLYPEVNSALLVPTE
jgi:hypothetical protein